MQIPHRRHLSSVAAAHSRPAGVPLLWQGPSPFEYRGLETESFEETPRGSPSTAPKQAQHAQEPSKDSPMPQIPSTAPPLLKRNMVEAVDAQQTQHIHEGKLLDKVAAPALHSNHGLASGI